MVVELSTDCHFCDQEAGSSYRGVYFCRWHLLWFYLGLKYVSWID